MKKIAILNSSDFTAEQKVLFSEYIEFINERFSANYSGDSFCWYICDLDTGYHDNVGDLVSPFDSYSILTVEQWKELGISSFENEYTLYDGTVVTNVNPRTIVEMHNGEFALKKDCIHAELNDQWGLIDEVHETFHGSFYIEGTEDDLELVWSDYHDSILDSNNRNVHYGYIDGRCSQDWFYDRHNTAFIIDDDWFRNDDAARYHDYVYHNRDDRWYHADCYPVDKNASYHNLSRLKRFSDAPKFSIGFEIEKEDDDAYEIEYEELYDDTGWIKESDGSLDDDNGYELVSPAFDLYKSDIDDEINRSSDLRKLINADSSSKCGGHINIASSIFDTETLFEHVSGWLPLFYAMYEHRMEKNYSKAKKKHTYRYSQDKYSAIYIKDNVLEFRIPSAVKSVNNLLWRRDLMRIMCSSIKEVTIKGFEPYWKGASEVEVLQMMMNPKSKLYKHLRLVYTQDRLIDKVELFIKYSQSFNDKQLPTLIKSQIKPDNINNASEELGA